MTDERLREAPALREAAREVVRFYGTDRTWSLMYRTLLGSRIDDLDAALAATPETPTLDAPIQEDDYDGPYNTAGGHEHWSEA